MFCVIYAFHVLPGKEDDFLQAWADMTHLIRKHEGGWGSRLHHEKEGTYLAYAQWPDRETWENSGNKLPPEADEVRTTMRASCEQIETLHTMDMLMDLLSEPM